jgi:hypothetical protein
MNPLKVAYYRLGSAIRLIPEILFPPRNDDPWKIPVIINNFNRLDSLKQLISALEKRGYYNIHIIDNKSTYPALLEYYKECPYTVYLLEQNLGINAFWFSGLSKKFRREFFAYTDSDVVPVEECPPDFMKLFLDILKANRFARKAGFSLKIDDIPDHYAMKERVVNWEKQFFTRPKGNRMYLAPIDTTFALYRPRGRRRPSNYNVEMYRTAYPYMARHLPWYVNSSDPDEENRYYMEQSKARTSWTSRGREFIGNQT